MNSATTSSDLPLKSSRALKVFACFAFAYFLSYAFRSVNAVIAPELMADLKISNAQLGLLSAVYFVGFAAMQIPLGFALDKFGARRTESILLLIALTGSIMVAYANSLWGIALGRLLIGCGVSACLMAAFTAYRRWFAIEQQGQLASGMLVFGTFGALITTVPVQFALPVIGWRGLFLIMAVLVAIAYVGIRFGLPKFDDHPKHNNTGSSTVDLAIGVKDIVGHPFFLKMIPMAIVCHGGFLALQTLWIGPWMTQVLGVTSVVSAQILFAFNGTLLLGYAFNTWFMPRANRVGFKTLNYIKWMLGFGFFAQLCAITTHSNISWIFWIIFALTSTAYILGQSMVTAVFPSRHAGIVSTSYNLLIFVGAFTLQWGIGWAIDLLMAAGLERANAFREIFLIFLMLQIVAYIWFLFYPKPLKYHLADL